MILYGASGHAKVIIDCMLSQNIPLSAIYDDNLEIKELLTNNVIGKYNPQTLKDKKLIISIGDNNIRKNIAKNIKHKFGTVSHRTAIISEYSNIGEGTVIFHNAVIQSGSVIGNHVIINTSASIDHDCIIEDYVHVSPNATLCGGVKIGEGTHFGAGAIAIPNIKIGKWCIIGAGAVIIKDVPDNAVVVGNPGCIIKYREINE